MASALEADDPWVREAQWAPTTRAAVADETVGTIVSDDPRVTRAEAAAASSGSRRVDDSQRCAS